MAIIASLMLTGCRDKIEVYRVAKEEVPALDPHAGHNHPPGQHGQEAPAGMPRLSWTLPINWEEAQPGEMRLASFRIKGQDGKVADFGIFPLPGSAGGDFNNVNRWRGQVGLEPLSQEQLATNAEPVAIAGGEGKLYDMAGENTSSGEPTRILGAIQHSGGVAWFFKVTGDDKLVAENKPALLEFLKTLKFITPAAELPPDHPPVGSMPASSPAGQPSQASGDHPQWTVPSGWQEAPPGQFLIAKFNITEGSAAAAVNISMSPGDGGGVAGNINRWRRQVGLPELAEADVLKTVTGQEINGLQVTMVELAGKDARTGEAVQVIGAIAPQAGRTWFYKLSGAGSLVTREKQAFQTFLGSVKY